MDCSKSHDPGRAIDWSKTSSDYAEFRPGYPRSFYERIEEHASSHLAGLGKILAGRNVSWTAEIAYGARGETILAEADKLKADLIVIRSHAAGRGEARPSGFGTLSFQIGILATCHVLLVK